MQKNNYYLDQINEKNEISNNYIRYGSQFNLNEIPDEHLNHFSFLGSIFINGFSDCDINNKTLQLFSQTFLECQNYPDDVIEKIFLINEINGYKVNFNSISELYLSFVKTYLKTNLSKEKLFEFLFFHNGEDYLINLFKLEDYLLDFGISIYSSIYDNVDLVFDYDPQENKHFSLQDNFNIERLTDTLFYYLIPKGYKELKFNLGYKRTIIFSKNNDKKDIYNLLKEVKEHLLEIPI
tara:strand:+ start:689 stop:1399 length:711 start_codon:yes stop_codon:yes gene_type:complete